MAAPTKKILRFAIIGAGLIGREFASATARWCHLVKAGTMSPLPFAPKLTFVCDVQESMLSWFKEAFPEISTSTNYRDALASKDVDAVYCAVPHNLHESIYIDIINSGKHLLGEKPFGIDKAANDKILEAIKDHPGVLVRCSSEFPFYPGAYMISKWLKEEKFGKIIEVEAGFHHSSDLDPNKPINWKRIIAANGMHVVHIPFRFGFVPTNVRALFSKVVADRPGADGKRVPCETWDNASLACEVEHNGSLFPMILTTKRVSPGDMNTWFIRIIGTSFSADFTTKNPRQIRTLPYTPGGAQAWHVTDIGFATAYPTITGGIFEFGFPDAILQMWAAFCDEMANGKDKMTQFFNCATPDEAAQSHRLFTAALESQKNCSVVKLK